MGIAQRSCDTFMYWCINQSIHWYINVLHLKHKQFIMILLIYDTSWNVLCRKLPQVHDLLKSFANLKNVWYNKICHYTL
jgi:hypothetical protein